MSKFNNTHVIRIHVVTKKGFAVIIKGSARGMDRITSETLEADYELCSDEHFNKHYGKRVN